MKAPFIACVPAHWLTLCGLLLLGACASVPTVPDNPDWERHRSAVTALSDWTLAGRLNVRQQNQSDTVQINWNQQGQDFDLRLSSSLLGLGATHVRGSPNLVTVERAGSDAVTLPGLSALTQEYFGYDFPTAQLLYWVRGVPAPDLPAQRTLDANQLLGSLSQTDTEGRLWLLEYDRYQAYGQLWLPGRIRVQREGLRLTFLNIEWRLPQPLSQPDIPR